MSPRLACAWIRRVGSALLVSALLLIPASGLAADTSKGKAPLVKKKALKTRAIGKKATTVPSRGRATAAGPPSEAPAEPGPGPNRRRNPGNGGYQEDWSSPQASGPQGSERVDQGGGSMLRSGSPEGPVASEVAEEAAETAEHEPGQIMVLHSDMSAAIAFGKDEKDLYRVRLRERLEATGWVLTVLQVRGETQANQALQDLSSRHPDLGAALNHRYRLSAGDKAYGPELVEWGQPAGSCGKGMRIGVLDTDVATGHEALAGAAVQVHSVLPPGREARSARPRHGHCLTPCGASGRRLSGPLARVEPPHRGGLPRASGRARSMPRPIGWPWAWTGCWPKK